MSIDLIGPIDARPAKPKRKFTLWCFYDKGNNLLYVTKNVNQAVMRNKDWWCDADHVNMFHYETAGELEDAKLAAIQLGKSKWNIKQNG